MTQESYGFSPADLVFGLTVQGPLKLPPSHNLLDFVCNFHSTLIKACELTRQNMIESQEKLKGRYDKKKRHQVFPLGDKELVLLPPSGFALQA